VACLNSPLVFAAERFPNGEFLAVSQLPLMAQGRYWEPGNMAYSESAQNIG
jgi:hypothetical protein